jgi:hypothetical protein
MALIEIPLNSYRYHFRRLTWQEESSLTFPKGEDQRRILLSTAMVDISGLKVTRKRALEVLKLIPEPLMWRIWSGGTFPKIKCKKKYLCSHLYLPPGVIVSRHTEEADARKETNQGSDITPHSTHSSQPLRPVPTYSLDC